MPSYFDRFLVMEGRTFKLLCRDEENLYLVTIGKYRNRKLESTLSQLTPAQMELMNGQNQVEVLPVKLLSGIAIGGVEAEDSIYLYLPEKRRRLILRQDLDRQELEGFFCDVKHNQPPQDKRKQENPGYWRKELQDPKIKKQLKWVKPLLIAVSFLSATFYVFARTLPWLLACTACLVIPVVLDICLPAYFTLRPQKSYASRFVDSLILPLGIVGTVLFFSRVHYWGLPWQLVKLAGICALGCTVLMLLAQEFRRKKSLLIGVFLTAFLIGGGLLQNFNFQLPQPEPETTVAQVVNLQTFSRRRRSTTYSCTFQMPDGEVHTVVISRELYISLEEGGDVLVHVYEGALDIPYFRVSGVPD